MSTYLHWFKSSYSGSEGECVEVTKASTTIHVRDSKDTALPGLTLSPTAWAAFTHAAARADMPGPCDLT